MRWLRAAYSRDVIADFLQRRGARLTPRDRAYWALVAGVAEAQSRRGRPTEVGGMSVASANSRDARTPRRVRALTIWHAAAPPALRDCQVCTPTAHGGANRRGLWAGTRFASRRETMDRDAVVRSCALGAIPLIVAGLYLARERPKPTPAPAPSSAAPAEPKGLGALAGDLAERGEAALATPKSNAAPSAPRAPSAPPADAVAATNLPLAERAHDRPARAPKTRGSCGGVEVRLITDSPDPSWAFASLSPSSGERAVIRRVGERIGGYRVDRIEWDRVWLSGGGGRCAASLHFGARDGDGMPDARDKREPWRLSGEMVSGIEKLGETHYAVDRGLVPAIYQQAGRLLAGLSIEPVRRDADTVGFELGEVRADSLLERLGVETGDRVLAIGDTPARDLDALIGALAAARDQSRLVARLERQGEAFELRVTVR